MPDLGSRVGVPPHPSHDGAVPSGLDRRFEAVVLWSAARRTTAPTAAALIDLGRAGVLVGVMAPVGIGELVAEWEWPTTGATPLLLADSRGVGAAPAGPGTVAGTIAIVAADAHEVAVGTVDELVGCGVDRAEVLFLMEKVSEEMPLTAPDGVASFVGTPRQLRRLMADQLRRRRQGALPAVADNAGWSHVVDGFDPEQERVHEALLTLADGHVGISGAPLTPHPSRRPWVVAGGIYDGDGAEAHLITGPRVFELQGTSGAMAPLRRVLDLRRGILHEWSGIGDRTAESVRFASLAEPTTAVLRVRCPKGLRAGPPVLAPLDDAPLDAGRAGTASWVRVAASTGGLVAAGVQARTRPGADGSTLDRFAVYRSDADAIPDPAPAVESLEGARSVGFDRLLAAHRQAWARRWDDADVIVEGDDELQQAIRFSLFHLMASAGDQGEAAVGARGLTGTGYRGHVFWDADVFVLPFLAATHPASARAMLEYRVTRIPAALDAARAAGRAGARFPWESARTGGDVTPTSARDRSGRIVAIRTGQLEEHIVSDVAWAACCYVDWTGDEEFAAGAGRRILVETARYWASRIELDTDGAHIRDVIGPDEYHERVDDNAYTNVMARWNLRRAADVEEAGNAERADVEEAGNAERADDAGRAGEVSQEERRSWTELADALVDGYDVTTGVYEQFAGFGELEPLIIEEVAPRRPIAADVLLGAERVAGAQVIKQADVLMLHHLVPDEVVPGSLEANLRFYEPRTAHGSSLSPATHAALLARVGSFDKALESLRLAARMDLDDLTGSTAGGLHVATMGGLWQALAFGFAGVRPKDGLLQVDPVLPDSWSALQLRLRFRGARICVRAEHSRLLIESDRNTAVVVGGTPWSLGPGTLELHRRGPHWEVTP